jgi:site-specific recombinase XerD
MTRKMTIPDAVERYLQEKRPSVSESTLYNHSSTLNRFIEFCEQEGIKQMSELDAFHLSDFRLSRQEQVSDMTVYNDLSTVRVYIKWADKMDLVESGLAESMMLPNPDGTRDTKIEPETANQILDYLDKFEYATSQHVLFALLWDTGFRIGTVRALDTDDYHPDDQYLEIHHRPETDTPLKNGQSAEREVNLHGWVCDLLDDYISMNRHNMTDDHGREPLLTTQYGRPHTTYLRAHINALTRPCHYTGECPHDRTQADCEATQRDYAQRCPSSVSPHPIRRSAITAWLNDGHSKELLSDRMDVSTDTLDKHYDARTEQEKRQLRREQFDMN